MQIIDPHHHLWDLSANYYPWLVDEIRPRLCGEYSAIRKDYLIGDFLRDISCCTVVKSVHVQAEHDRRDPVRETRWLQALSDQKAVSRGFPHGIVAYADLSSATAEQVLEGHSAFANVRGIRQSLNGAINDPAHAGDLLADPLWSANLALLERFHFSFDMQVYPQQMDPAAEIVGRNERIQFILCHAGAPADPSPEGRETWRRGMRRLAERPNVVVKISGFGMFDRRWTTDTIRPLVLETIDLFGVGRCMFASNFPVDGMAATYRDIWRAFEKITEGFAEAERRQIFHDNAARYYRI
jgi:predicted TIM-barrel fold metal-dependent hydrolase